MADLDAPAVARCVTRMRAQRPLVQCFPNIVAAEITANVLLAAGAAPAMVIGIEEAPEFAASKATVLSINCGALTTPALESMRAAVAAANSSERRPPWVLDPVACGGTAHRTAACRGMLELRPSVVRANASELLSLANASGARSPRGVDTSEPAEAALVVAEALAREQRMVIVVTGPTDYVTDGTKTLAVTGGAAEATQVTGTGCALSALIGAFVATADGTDGLSAVHYAAACCCFYKGCTATAAASSRGPGSFKVHLMDALAIPELEIANMLAEVTIRYVEPRNGHIPRLSTT